MSRGRALLLGVGLPVVVLGAAGVAGAGLWVWWADPPDRSEVTATNLELLVGQMFGVEARYAAIGLALGAVVAAGLTLLLRRVGWLLVVGVTLGALIAAAVSYWLGAWWGPQPPGGVGRGDLLSGALVVMAKGLLLSWPVGALAALWLVVWAAERRDDAGLSDLPPV